MGRRCRNSGYEHLEILASDWFHPNVSLMDYPVIGVVKVRDTVTGEVEEYFGMAEGKNKRDDEDFIILHGALFVSK